MTTAKAIARPVPFLTLVGWTTLATLFLFFIDEGNLSLDGLWEMHNLAPMAIYFAGILAVTGLLALLTARWKAGAGRTLLVLLGGAALGTVAVVGLFLGLG